MNEEKNEHFILDLSKKCLKKVPRQEDAQNCRVLILDDNELQKIDNIDSYLRIEKLSLSKNQLLRMYGVCRLQRLRELNLSFNGILTIEGVKELIHLQHLNLEGNNIKTIEHLNTNTKLEYLNLSENSIGSISDISCLKSLKELYLQGNRITHLRQCDKHLPISLEILSLAKNAITDLNEICTLSNLCNLHSITIAENPCVQMTGGTDGFDHRPFVLNWCMSVKVIDGFMVDPIESLKAEWLFSQGRGRQFRVGEQTALAKYLSSVCPLLGKALENENERKLRLILSKAQQHQRQLQEEISENLNTSGGNSPSSGRKKQTSSRIQSPRFSRLGQRQGSPDSMSNSYHGNTSSHSISISQSENHVNQNHMLQMTTSLIENIKNDSMSQGIDITLTGNNCITGMKTHSPHNFSQDANHKQIVHNQFNDQNISILSGGPLAAASKMVPVPETLMSPDCCPSSMSQRVINTQNLSSKLLKNKENKSCSPKINKNSHLRRSSEKSPVLSPRRINTALQNNQNNKISSIENQEIRVKNLQNSIHITPPDDSGTLSSDDDSDHINVDKLKTIRSKAAQKNREQKETIESSSLILNNDMESSAIIIQKIWRGYKTRKETKDIAEKLLKKRTIEYIEKLTKDMESTKAQLENERKIQQLQMQAINALWKKVSTMQNAVNPTTKENIDTNSVHEVKDGVTTTQVISLDNNTTAVVTDLAKTCTMLTNQVQQLQCSMRDILNCMSLFCNLPHESLKKIINNEESKDSAGTQTEIVAVHTPQLENQNFLSKVRPSSLPLTADQSSNTVQNPTVINSSKSDEKLDVGENKNEDNVELDIENLPNLQIEKIK